MVRFTPAGFSRATGKISHPTLQFSPPHDGKLLATSLGNMKAVRVTEVLVREHAQIRALLDDLERAVLPTDLDAISHIVAELDTLVNLHRRKEEQCLFPALKRCVAFPSQPLDLTTHEHGLEGVYLSEVRSFALTARHDPTFLPALEDACNWLIILLRDHLWKEEKFLFPCAEKSLNARVKRTILRKMNALPALPAGRRMEVTT